MSQRTTEIKRLSEQPKAIVRDKQYYFNTLDIEHDLLKKAADIAERMMVAFMRENKVEVTVNVDDIADKIIAQIGSKLQPHVYIPGSVTQNGSTFDYDDGPVIIKTEKIEVKGKIGTTSKTGDSINDAMDALGDMTI